MRPFVPTPSRHASFLQDNAPRRQGILLGRARIEREVAAHIVGVYVYCFGNKMSTMTPKTVMFSMDVGNAPKDANPDDADSNKDYGIYARFNYFIESVFKSIIISWKG